MLRRLRLLLRLCLALVILLACLIAAAVVYDSTRPPVSNLMAVRSLRGEPVDRRWVPLSGISEHLIAAVIMSEDGQFCAHHGVDWDSLDSVLHDPDGPSREERYQRRLQQIDNGETPSRGTALHR